MYDTVGNVFQHCQRSWSLIPAWWSCLNAAVFLASTCAVPNQLPNEFYQFKVILVHVAGWWLTQRNEWLLTVVSLLFSVREINCSQGICEHYICPTKVNSYDKETWGKLWTLRNTRCLRTNTRTYTHSTWKSNCVHYTSYVTNRIFENWGMFNISPVLAGAYSVT